MQDFTNMMNGRFDFLYEYDYSPEGFLPFFIFWFITLYIYNIFPKAYD